MSSFLRVIWFGIQGFRRNIWLSLMAVFTMTLMLTAITVFTLANVAASQANKDFNNNIDYIIFLKDSASDPDIDLLRQQIDGRTEVKESTYYTKEDVLNKFEQIFGNDETLKGVITAESNPLPREIDVRFSAVDKIKDFNEFINEARFGQIIEKTSYLDNEKAIDNYLGFVRLIKVLGLSLTGFFVLVSVIVILNTIRLAIHARREEIEIMRLVGATWQYIRGPFLVEGVFYGVLGALFSSVIMWGILDQLLNLIANDLNLFNLDSVTVIAYLARATLNSQEGFSALFNQLALAQLAVGLFLGVVCSAFAVRKYLREC